MAVRSGEPARAVARRLVERMAAAWMRKDTAAIVELFAPDALFVSPAGAVRGHAQIAAAARSFFEHVERVSIELRSVLVDGNQGVAVWSWHETVRGATDRRVRRHCL